MVRQESRSFARREAKVAPTARRLTRRLVRGNAMPAPVAGPALMPHGEEGPVVAKSRAGDLSLSAQHHNFLPGIDAPQAQRSVIAPTGEAQAVGAERQRL